MARKPLCDELRKYAGEASGAGDVEPQDLQRIKPRTVLVFVSLAIAFYLLIPQLADVSGVWSKLKDADWTWALYALGASALTYVGATIGLLGAVPGRIPFFGTFATQLAARSSTASCRRAWAASPPTCASCRSRASTSPWRRRASACSSCPACSCTSALSFIFLLWAGRSGVGRLRLPALGPDRADRPHRRSSRSPGCCSCCRPGAACCASASCRILRRAGQGIGDGRPPAVQAGSSSSAGRRS